MSGQPTPLLAATGLTVGYPGRPVLRELTLEIARGERVALLGPNGAGKTTLLRALGGLLAPQRGSVLLDGKPLHTWPARERARRLAGVPQLTGSGLPLRVRDLVATGRLPHVGDWAPFGAADEEALTAALRAVDLLDRADRLLDELSAGERQRAWLALALAQQPEVLLLDEPTAHLDLHQAWHLLELLSDWADQRSLTVIFSSHDLNLAAAFCSRVVLLQQGKLIAEGSPISVYQPAVLSEAYGHPLTVQVDAGLPRVWPQRLAKLPKA